MIKSILRFALLCLFCLLNGISNAQAPDWIWAKSEGGTNYDLTTSVAVDAFGNIYVTGTFSSSTVTLGTTVLTNAGGNDIFLVKYDTDGNVLWAKSAGGLKNEYAYSLALDPSGNAYITGSFSSDSCLFGTITEEPLTLWLSGYEDMFLAKYDVNGNAVWVKNATGTFRECGYSVSVDASGNPCVAGWFGPTITFDTITLTNTNITFEGLGDVFLAKYNANGDVLWAKSAGGPGNDVAYSGVADASGNIYVTGWFDDPAITFDTISLTSAGGYDVFLAKFDANGNVIWVKSAGGTGSDLANSVAVDDTGEVYLAGSFKSTQIGFGSANLQNAGYFTEDVFLAKYNTDGNELWANSAGGSGSDEAYTVAVDTSGNPLVAGFYNSAAITFGSHSLTNTKTGDFDTFLSKYDADGNAVWATGTNGTDTELAGSVAVDASENIYLSGWYRSPTLSCGPYSLTNAGAENFFLAKLNSRNLGFDRPENSSPLSVYPNPATGVVTIGTPGNLLRSELTIVDLCDRELIRLQITGPITQIDVRSLPAGVYMIRLAGLKGVQVCKFVKQ
ncbi:MAG: SBBP repeat-containing protein [Bacteroidales bacterium]|nr:SBBP repeat-containing protein [Bacteroidales bacterium]